MCYPIRFPSFLRAHIQNALHEAWTTRAPIIQRASPASLAATLLYNHLGSSLGSYTYIDFCAGSGGPTPAIERIVNRRLRHEGLPAVNFVLTDLHPNPEAWARAAAQSDHILYEPSPLDATAADAALLDRYTKSRHDETPQSMRGVTVVSRGSTGAGKKQAEERKVFRLFNLAFHHFDDPLARAILKNTLETSQGFAIFELQGRNAGSFLTCTLLGIAFLLAVPYHAWRLRAPELIVFTYIIPVLPFVLVFDGYISSLRTRTPAEVEALMRTCGASMEGWELRSGSEVHLWPCGSLDWIIATKKDSS